jgi:hypothetical protein
MAFVKRELTMQDVAIMALSAESTASSEVYRAVEAIAADTVGWRLFTVLRYVETVKAVERLYSSDEKAYPVGGLALAASAVRQLAAEVLALQDLSALLPAANTYSSRITGTIIPCRALHRIRHEASWPEGSESMADDHL